MALAYFCSLLYSNMIITIIITAMVHITKKYITQYLGVCATIGCTKIAVINKNIIFDDITANLHHDVWLHKQEVSHLPSETTFLLVFFDDERKRYCKQCWVENSEW